MRLSKEDTIKALETHLSLEPIEFHIANKKCDSCPLRDCRDDCIDILIKESFYHLSNSDSFCDICDTNKSETNKRISSKETKEYVKEIISTLNKLYDSLSD